MILYNKAISMIHINALWLFFVVLLFNEKDKSNQLSSITSTFSGPFPCNSSSLSQNTCLLFALKAEGRE